MVPCGKMPALAQRISMPPCAVAGRFGHQLHVAHAGDVSGVALGRSAVAAKLVGAGLSLGQVARDNEDFAAVAGEHLGNALADALASAGYDH